MSEPLVTDGTHTKYLMCLYAKFDANLALANLQYSGHRGYRRTDYIKANFERLERAGIDLADPYTVY